MIDNNADTSSNDVIRVFIVEDHANLRELLGMYCRMQDERLLPKKLWKSWQNWGMSCLQSD